jgi:hypothetical protein
VVELDDGYGDGLSEDQVLPIWKRRKRKTKWAQGKGIFKRAILFCLSLKTPSGHELVLDR